MEIMPVKYEEFFNEEFGLDVSTTASASTSPQSDFFLSEDLWKKFESEYSELFRATYFDDFVKELTIDNPIDSLFAQVEDEERQQGFCNVFKAESSDNVMLHNHDCMWAGHCGSSEHPVEESRLTDKFDSKPLSPMIGAGAMQYAAPVACKGAMSQTPAQQSLLKPSLRSAGLPVINMTITPQTPPMSDDEDKHQIKQTQVLKIFPTPDDYDDTDQDLCEYFDGKLDGEEDAEESSSESSSSSSSSSSSESEDEEEPQPGPSTSYPSNVTSIRSNVYATENDHSYHKDKNASMRMSNLGIDTPSDSEEEEIDVVSVSEKYTAASRMNYALPTNPSMSDRRHLQKTMESAMGTRRPNNNNGLKIILPTKRTASSVPSSPPTKRKAAPINDSRGAKRAKQYRITNPTPYRRRGNYGHDSESEPEPSEKRSLHNNMERQRRIDLRNAFEYLRQLVPEVLKKERAAKVVILREAAKYCDQLTYNSMSLNRQVEDLKRHQEILRMRVSMLRRNLALKR